MTFIVLRYFPFIPILLSILISGYCILASAFIASIDEII